MRKYGELVIFPCGFDEWAIVAEYADYEMNLDAGGLNLYGVTIKVVHTMEKAFRLAEKYSRKMGRTL